MCSLLTPDSGEASGVIWTLRGDNLLPASKSQSLKLLVEAGPNPGCYFYKVRSGCINSKDAHDVIVHVLSAGSRHSEEAIAWGRHFTLICKCSRDAESLTLWLLNNVLGGSDVSNVAT